MNKYFNILEKTFVLQAIGHKSTNPKPACVFTAGFAVSGSRVAAGNPLFYCLEDKHLFFLIVQASNKKKFGPYSQLSQFRQFASSSHPAYKFLF